MKDFFYALNGLSKKVYFVGVLSLLISSAWADQNCFWRLMKEPSGPSFPDSVYHYLGLKELPPSIMTLSPLQRAKSALIHLGRKLNCRPQEMEHREAGHKDTCHSFSGLAKPKVCVLEREIGYFIYSQDYGEGIHFIFNRWD